MQALAAARRHTSAPGAGPRCTGTVPSTGATTPTTGIVSSCFSCRPEGARAGWEAGWEAAGGARAGGGCGGCGALRGGLRSAACCRRHPGRVPPDQSARHGAWERYAESKGPLLARRPSCNSAFALPCSPSAASPQALTCGGHGQRQEPSDEQSPRHAAVFARGVCWLGECCSGEQQGGREAEYHESASLVPPVPRL